LFSQRGDVVVSGRITPTVPLLAALEPPLAAGELLLLLPQAVSASVHNAPTAARLAHFDVAIDYPSFLLGRAFRGHTCLWPPSRRMLSATT
jgi:hypothetical protein